MTDCNCVQWHWELYPDGQWTCTNCGQLKETVQSREIQKHPLPGRRGGMMAIQQEEA